jgi:hypothetical protein
MYEMIAQSCDGVAAGHLYRSNPNLLDEGKSQIFASSLFVALSDEGQEIGREKDSDDKVVIGYTRDGMGFQMVIDGFYGGETNKTFRFIDDYVVPLMSQYSSDLGGQIESKEVTTSLIRTIYGLRAAHAVNAEFTMSLVMTYQKENILRCAGFGIGDTGLLIKRLDGTVEQLVPHTVIDGFKDAFDTESSANIDLVIKRNTVFDTQVRFKEELVGYTYMPPQLEILAQEFQTENIRSTNKTKQTVRHQIVDVEQLSGSGTLVSQLLDLVKKKQPELVEQAKKTRKECTLGDDFTVGSLIIPPAKLINQLKIKNLIRIISNDLTDYINILATKSNGFFSRWFTDTEQTLTRAKLYKQLITDETKDDFTNALVLIVMLSDTQVKQLSNNLVTRLNLPEASRLMEHLRALLITDVELRYEEVSHAILSPIQHVDNLIQQMSRGINPDGNINLASTPDKP